MKADIEDQLPLPTTTRIRIVPTVLVNEIIQIATAILLSGTIAYGIYELILTKVGNDF